MDTFSWSALGDVAARIALAYVLALPIGWNRQRARRHAGLRTFSLVAVASCGFVVMALRVFAGDLEAQARVVQGLMTGIGFIGGGAILKTRNTVRGTATAAGIWSTGLIGATVGYGELHIALVVSIVNLITFLVLTPLEKRMRQRDKKSPRTNPPGP